MFKTAYPGFRAKLHPFFSEYTQTTVLIIGPDWHTVEGQLRNLTL
jgi:hypothetical protein